MTHTSLLSHCDQGCSGMRSQYHCVTNMVSKHGSQFKGNAQHDALEFLLWLMDRVHEDSNPDSSNTNNAITSGSGSSSKTKAASKNELEMIYSGLDQQDVEVCIRVIHVWCSRDIY
ncbi:hypothetical protein NFI96_008768 [Prochilodus magdalenae]|nr:hypothetical protein NFI96_008768 [Prochilodus magdalenae]